MWNISQLLYTSAVSLLLKEVRMSHIKFQKIKKARRILHGKWKQFERIENKKINDSDAVNLFPFYR